MSAWSAGSLHLRRHDRLEHPTERRSISDEQVRSAARFVNADKFIDRLPKGYDEVVTERGSTLSVGQKQLLAFARAIAFNPEILLVLDEATSSVDTETEHLIQDALAEADEGPDLDHHRPPPVDDPERRPDHRAAQGPRGGDGLAPRPPRQRGVYHRLYELQYRAHETDASVKTA
jgi:ATP-binding cassette subfamily B protein